MHVHANPIQPHTHILKPTPHTHTHADIRGHKRPKLRRAARGSHTTTHTYTHTHIHTQTFGVTNGLSFEEQFWSLSTTLEPAPLIYGLGQQKTSFRLAVGEEDGIDVYTLWARDPGSTPDHDPKGGSSLYGSHPFYMQVSYSIRAVILSLPVLGIEDPLDVIHVYDVS
jgi:hypothetical protein